MVKQRKSRANRRRNKGAAKGVVKRPTTGSYYSYGGGRYEASGPWTKADGYGINQRYRARQVVTMSTGPWPELRVSARANAIMWCIVQLIDVEASWYATTRWEDENIYIDDVFIPQQTGSYGLTTITAQGEQDLMMDILMMENGREVLDSLRCWGHSHHTMGVFASSQDESQAREQIATRDGYYVRLIMNKRGDLNATVYLIDQELAIENAKCTAEPIDPDTFGEILEWVNAELQEKHTVQSFCYGEGMDPEAMDEYFDQLYGGVIPYSTGNSPAAVVTVYPGSAHGSPGALDHEDDLGTQQPYLGAYGGYCQNGYVAPATTPAAVTTPQPSPKLPAYDPDSDGDYEVIDFAGQEFKLYEDGRVGDLEPKGTAAGAPEDTRIADILWPDGPPVETTNEVVVITTDDEENADA